MRDYLVPLDRLPELRQPRPDGRLGFTSARYYLESTEQLVVGAGQVGYKLNFGGRAVPTQPPHWTIVSSLVRVNWRGERVKLVDRAVRRSAGLHRGRGGGVRFEVGSKPGPYRLLVSFRSRAGRNLARYGFYFRVVDPVDDRRLVLDATTYRPQETVFAQLQNWGTTGLGFGLGYQVERLTGSGWAEAPESPRGPVPAIAMLLRPGGASDCTGFWIPPTMESGRYRIERGGLYAEFDLVG